jgi:phytoene synthase
MDATLARSWSYCERLARREAGNFYHAFRVLPAPQRRAMCALYAFLRITDDLADEPAPLEVKEAALTSWRCALDSALAGDDSHRLHPALRHTVERYRIPRQYLTDALDGVTMDLAPVSYDTFADLYGYCYRVASVVGLSCIHIWGFADEKACDFAEKAGIAFQLTNILRDLGEDVARQRVYLPREDLERFGYSAEQLARGERGERFRDLMQFEVARARSYYDAALPLVELLEPPGQAVFLILYRTYRGLLDAIERRDYDVFSSRVRLSRWHKLGLVLQALPVRWGWTAFRRARRPAGQARQTVEGRIAR